MKKRKPPIVLATFLIIGLVAMALVYSPKKKASDEQNPQQNEPQMENVDRPKLTSDQTSSLVKSAMKPNMPTNRMPQKPGMPGMPNEPSIKVNKAVNSKPMPNDSSTSTQWYTNETPKPKPGS